MPEFLRELAPPLTPSLLGTLAARVPGREDLSVRASFGRVHVASKIEGGFAYTEVEEELLSDGDRQTEVIAAFRAPLGGVIARMALWVDDRWIDAEVVERQEAGAVYRGIVERRRDPALLEQDPSGSVKLRVFPVPAHGSRRVVVGYAQPLEHQEGQYRFELGLRLPEGGLPVAELAVEVELAGLEASQLTLPGLPSASVEPSSNGTRVRWQGSRFRPLDWRLSFRAPDRPLTTFVPVKAKGQERFVALRVAPSLPVQGKRDASVWLIDTSVGQGGAALDSSKLIALELLKKLPAEYPFAILACDTACTSFPRRGLASVTPDSRKAAERYIAGLVTRGASDIGYALQEALSRTVGRKRPQLVYLGDAQPTAGDLDVEQIVGRLAGRGEQLDLRLIGVGVALNADSLGELAGQVTAARTIIGGAAGDTERVGRWLEQPMLRAPSLRLPSVFQSPYPRQLPNLVQGDEQLVLARLGRGPSNGLQAQLSGLFDTEQGPAAWSNSVGYELPQRALQQDSAPRLWAHARLRDLDDDDGPSAYDESVELSKRYQVLSRHTSFLALESNAMFRGFGIEQRFGRADFGPVPAVVPRAPRASPTPARTHRVRAPVLRAAYTKVSGRVPPEAIQNAVRRNDGRFRACYHEGLLRNPKLEGIVVTRFLIARDGTVPMSMDSDSKLPDRAVVDCIVRTFKMLRFPAPDGVVTVIYPFALSPSTEKEPRTLPTPWSHSEEPPLATLAPAPLPASAPEPPPLTVKAIELAAQVELDPANVELQLATARAYEVERSERRACAHFRAAATLAPRELETQYQALRCRARVLHERASVLADIARRELQSPSIDALATSIRTLGEIPPFVPPP